MKNKSRRKFLKKLAVASSAPLLATACANTPATPIKDLHTAFPNNEKYEGDQSTTLGVGLIGCGGRGLGAAFDAVKADKNCNIVAVADIFDYKIKGVLNKLKRARNQYAVSSKNRFLGFDAYKKLINLPEVDIVILATPTYFRPEHLQYAVSKNKHVFAEKPWFVDAYGANICMKVAEEAKKKKLTLISGLCYRYQDVKKSAIRYIKEGAIGEIKGVQSYYHASTVGAWYNGKSMSDALKSWQRHTWLSGDHIVEQAIHSLDKAFWALGDLKPVKAIGLGGRISRKKGNIYDHFSVRYFFKETDAIINFSCRQINNVDGGTVDIFSGDLGQVKFDGFSKVLIKKGEEKKTFSAKENMYLSEWKALINSVRNNLAKNDAHYTINSGIGAIMGRESAYTGKTVRYDEFINFNEKLGPKAKRFTLNSAIYKERIPRPGINYL